MKAFTTLLFLFPLFVFSQNVSVSELSSLRVKSPGDVEDILVSKGWELISTNKDEYGTVIIGYSYERSSFGNKAKSFIEYCYQLDSKGNLWDENVIFYQFFNPETFRKMTTELKGLKYIEKDYLVSKNVTERHYRSSSGKTIAIASTQLDGGSDGTMSSNYNIYSINLWPPTLYEHYPKDDFYDNLKNRKERDTSTLNKKENEVPIELTKLGYGLADVLKSGEINIQKSAYIYTSPSYRSKILGVAETGKATFIGPVVGDYIKVRYKGKEGFVLLTYIKVKM